MRKPVCAVVLAAAVCAPSTATATTVSAADHYGSLVTFVNADTEPVSYSAESSFPRLGPLNVLVERVEPFCYPTSCPPGVEVTERSGALLVAPRIDERGPLSTLPACEYITPGLSAHCPAESVSIRITGSMLADTLVMRDADGSVVSLFDGNDVATATGNGFIGIDGGDGDDTLTAASGYIVGLSGADVLRATAGGGRVSIDTGENHDPFPSPPNHDKVYARNGEVDHINCAQPPAVLEVDTNDVLEGDCT